MTVLIEKENNATVNNGFKNSISRYIASLLFFIAFSPYIFDEWVYQFEMLVFGNVYHLPLNGPMILSFMIFIYLLRAQKKNFIIDKIFIVFLMVIVFLMGYDLLILSVGINYVIHSWGQFLIFPLIFLLLINTPSILSLDFIKNLILVFGFSSSILSICQYILNAPIVSVGQPGSFFNIFGWQFFGHVRGFGLFASPYASGSFYTLMVVYMFFRVVSIKKLINKAVALVILFVFFLALLTTVTRSVYIGLFIAIFIAFIAIKKPDFLLKNYNKILIFQFFFGMVIIYLAPLAALMIKADIFSVSTLSIRLNEWILYGLPLLHKISYIIFGMARMQSISHCYGGFSGDILVDNTYLAVLIFGGLTLFFSFMFFYYKIGKYIVRLSVCKRDPFGLACLCVFLTMPFASFFNITYTVFPTFAFLALLFLKNGEVV